MIDVCCLVNLILKQIAYIIFAIR